ncbi:enoyl-CoA hydratase/isomerase family protein [Nocardia aurea]|uniref:enoyl-CoA hydratase/isomerase family protein n=1 Tax=Nocardia aurea TaxID=2144174 RepID=UPI000D68B2CE|nr:enoyl-CoA hydratase-related protein [Nocardia aurea]
MNESEHSLVRVEIASSLAVLTLARPRKFNAFDLAMARDLLDAVRQVDHLARSGAARAIVFAAEGKVFSVGGDLGYFTEGDDRGERMREVATALHHAVDILTTTPAPVVTALHGVAAGAGVGLALAGDIILAGPQAQLRLAYTAAGLSPDCGASWALIRIIGSARAMDLALTNRALDAAEAEKWGLVSRLTDSDDVTSEALTIAQQLATGSVDALATTKALLRSSLAHTLPVHLDSEADAISRLVDSPNGREGVDAFLAKRTPTFG